MDHLGVPYGRAIRCSPEIPAEPSGAAAAITNAGIHLKT
jgi:hypothetical protein